MLRNCERSFQVDVARGAGKRQRSAGNHLNYLKDLAPELGRNFAVVYNVKF